MKLLDVLKRFGTVALKSIPPASTAVEVLGAINSVLGPDQKLPPEATGSKALSAIQSTDNPDALALLDKEYDVEIAEIQSWTSIIESLGKVDIAGASTRPHIALLFAYCTAIPCVLLFVAVTIAVYRKDVDMIQQLQNIWPLIVGAVSPFLIVIRAYFGMRSKEKAQKYEAVSGTPSPIGMVAQIAGKLLRR